MTALILSFFPLKTLAGLLGGVGILAGLFVKSKVSAVQAQNQKVETAKAVVANHAVEQKAQAAAKPEDVYAALDADRASDT